MLWLLIVLLILVPIGWLISESQPRVWVRVTMGVVTIAMSYFVAFVVGSFQQLNYNSWYGSTSAGLIETVIANLEAGNEDALLRELKRLKEEYRPTYENRANYDKLVNAFVERLKVAPHDDGKGTKR